MEFFTHCVCAYQYLYTPKQERVCVQLSICGQVFMFDHDLIFGRGWSHGTYDVVHIVTITIKNQPLPPSLSNRHAGQQKHVSTYQCRTVRHSRLGYFLDLRFMLFFLL